MPMNRAPLAGIPARGHEALVARRHPGWHLIGAAAAACGVLAGCASPVAPKASAALDAVLAFSDPAMCQFTEDTSRLLAGFVRNDPDTLSDRWIRPGTVPAHLREQLGPITRIKHDGWWTIRTQTRGKLWGLPLAAIEQDFPIGGDPGGITFEFLAPVEIVERAARRRGFPARAAQSVQMGEPDVYAYEMDLFSAPQDDRRSLLTCGYS